MSLRSHLKVLTPISGDLDKNFLDRQTFLIRPCVSHSYIYARSLYNKP